MWAGGRGTVAPAGLGRLFQAGAAALAARAGEAKDSRPWAGIHYPIDNETGIAGGHSIGRRVTDVGLLP